MRRSLAIGAIAAVVGALTIGLAVVAQGAILRVDNLVLKVDGSFRPQKLPAKRHAPITLRAHADLSARDGTIPPATDLIRLDFDRDGRLETRGLPVCDPGAISDATPSRARRICGTATVGTGLVEGVITNPSGPPTEGSSVVTIFNGPKIGGNPTVVIHAQITVPVVQTIVIVAPIVRIKGLYRHRVTIDVPPIVDGRGVITHISGTVARRYRSGGERRSYVAARCTRGILQARGRMTFSNPQGTIIEGPLQKPCTRIPVRGRR